MNDDQPLHDDVIKNLADRSAAARQLSYSPYSRFPVGAALLCDDGTVIEGCNVENVSFGLTNCAERTAVYRAVAQGKRSYRAVAVCAEMAQQFVGPCGACRQVLAEFNPTMTVILAKTNGDRKIVSLATLLPDAFLPTNTEFKK